MTRLAICLTFLLPVVGTCSNSCTNDADCQDDEPVSVNLLQQTFEVQSALAAQNSCKGWCANKVAKGASTWDTLCGWSDCSGCAACPTTTTTTTTLAPNAYCSGASLLGMNVKSGKRDLQSKIKREDQAMRYHHSYCGKAKTEDLHTNNNFANSSLQPPGGISRGDCAAFTSTKSPNGLANCDGEKNMPYAYAYHLHPTYDGLSKNAAQALQLAFQANFGVKECEHVDESTTYSTKERLCLLSTAKGCNKAAPESPDDVAAIFPLCQFGIYVRGGAMFDTTLGADGTSPWQWMTLNKDCFGADIDVLAHAVLCPSLAHGKWAFFVNGTHSTPAATWITGSNSVDGCYGQECNPSECEVAKDVVDGNAVYEALCCAVTALESVPLELDELMAKSYSNVLKFQSGGWWDKDVKQMKDFGVYHPEFPSTVWPEGKCQGVCSGLE